MDVDGAPFPDTGNAIAGAVLPTTVVFVVGVLLASACGTLPRADADAASDATDTSPRVEEEAPAEAPSDAQIAATGGSDDDVLEAVFRHIYAHNASGQQQHAGVICLTVAGANPSPVFLARFADMPIVKRGSACDTDASRGVVDKNTGARGLAFRATLPKYVDATHASVDGGYYEAGLSASGNTYDLDLVEGTWRVIRDVMHWIS